MSTINSDFSDHFGSHWIKIKFYNEKPKTEAELLRNVRFCEATKEAIMHPVLLDKKSISCEGAKHAFGWDSHIYSPLKMCQESRDIKNSLLTSLFTSVPRMKRSINYIGLNIEGDPDLVMSYMPPEEVMKVVNIYQNNAGKMLDVSITSMMSICGGIAVNTYTKNKICISFGCDDSRKYAEIGRETMAIGIPKKMFNMFVN
ncbi:MAG: DUF169 domain-containing protein [Endomicrobiales bacterium]|nr:DUF169 domain-containing protein [Endomicrobiales bacterium]